MINSNYNEEIELLSTNRIDNQEKNDIKKDDLSLTINSKDNFKININENSFDEINASKENGVSINDKQSILDHKDEIDNSCHFILTEDSIEKTSNVSQSESTFCQNEILTNSFKLFKNEFNRLGFNTKNWRYSLYNKNFTLCSTYPPYFIVPGNCLDEDLNEVSKFRHLGRLPTVVFRHKKNGAVIIRSSQPSVGLLGRRSIEDEKYLQMILKSCINDQEESFGIVSSENKLSSCLSKNLHVCDCDNDCLIENSNFAHNESCENKNNKQNGNNFCKCQCHIKKETTFNCQQTQSSKFFSIPDKIIENIMSYTSYNNTSNSNKKLLILDARSFTVAVLNRAIGGGSECSEYYPNCEVDFLYLANIHYVRNAFFSLKNFIRPNSHYFANWSKSNSNYWLHYITNLIESASKVVRAIDRDAKPVLIHCSDGWDRTPQIVSLAELMLDPYYRTMQGFKVLVQREWLDFGHKFADRCGVFPVSKNLNERSPIFLQWIDCVFQLINQCPDYFEFNSLYLAKLAFYTYTPLFGTFSCNNYLERFINQIHGERTSVWNHLEKIKQKLINPNFIETNKILEPSFQINDMVLWTDLYRNLITEEFESRFDLTGSDRRNNDRYISNQLRRKKIIRTFSSHNIYQNNLTKDIKLKLKKSNSESDLASCSNKIFEKIKKRKSGHLKLMSCFNLSNSSQISNILNSNQQLDSQNSMINGNSCKIESRKLEFSNNYDSEIFQNQVPLSVICKIAQLANSNPQSSLMYSILTYVNSLRTFSVK